MTMLPAPPPLNTRPAVSTGTPMGGAFTAGPPLLTDDEFTKLKEYVNGSYQALDRHRAQRKKSKAQYIGDSFGMDAEGGTYETLVNMVDQMVEVYMQQLVSANPQVMVITEKIALKTTARYFQMALNYVLRQINVKESLKFAVLESLFSPVCAVKVGVDKPSDSDRSYPFDVSAMPWVESIFFNDFVFDTSVQRWELCRFYGDRYMEHVDTLRADPRNDQEVLKNLEAGIESTQYNTTASSEESKLDSRNPYDTEKRDYVPLWDIYLPRKRLMVTYLANAENTKPLRVVKWNGPPTGPYKICRYKLVPNEILGKPPVGDIIALADSFNKQWSKASKQASRAKTVYEAPLASVADAAKVRDAQDGEIVPTTHKESMTAHVFPGPSQEMLATIAVTKNECSYQAGNLDTMGGLSSQADTLGQEQMLSQSSSGRIRARQNSVLDLVKECLWDVGWYLWNDPLVRITVTDKIPGTDVEMEMKWPVQPDEYGNEVDLRQGEYSDLNLTILPYSMRDKSPAEMSQQIDQMVMQIIIPAMQAITAQGLAFDWREYLKARADLLGIEQIKNLLIDSTAPIDLEQQVDNMGGTKPPVTSRTYDARGTKKPMTGEESAAQQVSSLSKPTQQGA